MARTVLILGMHRSGTSCLAQFLHHAGLYLGNDLINDSASDNLDGYWESREVVAINDAILAQSGGTWRVAPHSLCGHPDLERRMTAYLDSLRIQPIVGWKDPRTTLTFPVWKPLLGDYRIVAIFRHPLSVARSLQVRDQFSLEEGLALWGAYNERLLQYVAAEPAAHLIEFDSAPDVFLNAVRSTCLDLGLREPDPQVFNPFLRHHSAETAPADPYIQSLYEQLRTASRHAGSARSERLPEAATDKADYRQLQLRLEQLGRAQQAENQVVQHLSFELRKLLEQCADPDFCNVESVEQQALRRKIIVHQVRQHTKQWLEWVREEHGRAQDQLSQLQTRHDRLLDRVERLHDRTKSLEAFFDRVRCLYPYRLLRRIWRVFRGATPQKTV